MLRPDLDAIEARAGAATEGPLEAHNCGSDCCNWATEPGDREGQLAGFKTPADAEFFAHARTDVPDLVAYVRDLEARLVTAKSDALEEAADWLHGEDDKDREEGSIGLWLRGRAKGIRNYGGAR